MYYLIKDYLTFSNWFCSTNHKIIGMLYLLFGIWVAFLATFMSVLIRCELGASGDQVFLGDYHLYNVFVIGHGLPIFLSVIAQIIIFVLYIVCQTGYTHNIKHHIVLFIRYIIGFIIFCIILYIILYIMHNYCGVHIFKLAKAKVPESDFKIIYDKLDIPIQYQDKDIKKWHFRYGDPELFIQNPCVIWHFEHNYALILENLPSVVKPFMSEKYMNLSSDDFNSGEEYIKSLLEASDYFHTVCTCYYCAIMGASLMVFFYPDIIINPAEYILFLIT